MSIELTIDQVLALAPDVGVASASQKLVTLKVWPVTGQNTVALWGQCQGSALYRAYHRRWLAEWQALLLRLAECAGLHGLLQGRCCRLLLVQQCLDEAALQWLTGLALSSAMPIGQAAAWIEGLCYGSGLLLLHQDMLWQPARFIIQCGALAW